MEYFNFKSLISYTKNFLAKTSTKGLYIVLLLYYAYNGSDVPSWAKKIIIGALAYFVSPLDSIPDLTPFLGMTDDLGVLAFAVVTNSCYVNDDIRTQATKKLFEIRNGDVDSASVNEVDAWL